MSIRQQKRELARWETATRQWAADSGRRLAIDLHHGHELLIQPYTVGVVLWTSRNEHVWGQVPARCSEDTPLTVRRGQPRRGDPPPQPRITDWLVTSQRIVGRLYPDTLCWWEWSTIVGVQVDLTAGAEYVQLDPPLPNRPVRWYGPGVAPLAVAAIFHLHGSTAVVEHPGLAAIRQQPAARAVQTPIAELEPPVPAVRDIGL
jgi:hypothetical protein